jgi:hypothetical protein
MTTNSRPIREFLRIVERDGGKIRMRLPNLTELVPEWSADTIHLPIRNQ